ncbi:MAG: AAA family ATPase [Gemmatimonadota bacterium]|nr:MAG: AAA family ATPase [Gemmatimonadota bacterium]
MSEERPWSGRRPFVGRVGLLEALIREVDETVGGRGRAVFVLGPAGSGKTATLGLFQEEAFRRHRALKAEYVDCEASGARTWAELAELFTRGHRLKRSARNVAMEWLDVTVIGAIITAIYRTVEAVRTGRVPERRRRRSRKQASDSAVEAVRLLTRHGPLEPRLMILDSLERGDDEDLAGTFALLRRLPETRTLFVAATRTTDGRPPAAIDDLIREGERLGHVRRLDVPGLTLEEMRDAVAGATRAAVPDDWIAWLADESRGLPGALWAALGKLEEEGALRKSGRRWVWEGAPPQSETLAVQQQTATAIRGEDRCVLALAAALGPVFHSTVLAELAGVPELELEDRLARWCRAGLVVYRGECGSGAQIASEYAFRDTSDAEALAAEWSENQRSELRSRAQEVRGRLGLA